MVARPAFLCRRRLGRFWQRVSRRGIELCFAGFSVRRNGRDILPRPRDGWRTIVQRRFYHGSRFLLRLQVLF